MVGMFKHPTEKRSMTPREAEDFLMDELAKGHEVIPICDCDNFDFKENGGCQGHDDGR